MTLILASSSPYRRSLLKRLGLPFECYSPDIDETPLEHEAAPALASRLALLKAQKVAKVFDHGLIIGSDQVCVCQGKLLGKPGTTENAIAQLTYCNNQRVEFHTALVLLDAKSGHFRHTMDVYWVKFRALPESEIAAYVEREPALDCAGSFKAEGLGITLFESMHGQDFHSLIGLPLISLCQLLREQGLNPLL